MCGRTYFLSTTIHGEWGLKLFLGHVYVITYPRRVGEYESGSLALETIKVTVPYFIFKQHNKYTIKSSCSLCLMGSTYQGPLLMSSAK